MPPKIYTPNFLDPTWASARSKSDPTTEFVLTQARRRTRDSWMVFTVGLLVTGSLITVAGWFVTGQGAGAAQPRAIVHWWNSTDPTRQQLRTQLLPAATFLVALLGAPAISQKTRDATIEWRVQQVLLLRLMTGASLLLVLAAWALMPIPFAPFLSNQSAGRNWEALICLFIAWVMSFLNTVFGAASDDRRRQLGYWRQRATRLSAALTQEDPGRRHKQASMFKVVVLLGGLGLLSVLPTLFWLAAGPATRLGQSLLVGTITTGSLAAYTYLGTLTLWQRGWEAEVFADATELRQRVPHSSRYLLVCLAIAVWIPQVSLLLALGDLADFPAPAAVALLTMPVIPVLTLPGWLQRIVPRAYARARHQTIEQRFREASTQVSDLESLDGDGTTTPWPPE